MNFPEDADGDALRELATRVDISKPITIEFVVVVPNEDGAKSIAARVVKLGYEPSVEFDEETDEWACYCEKCMVPTYDAIVAAQEELDRVGRDHDGYADGWGTFGADAS